MQIKLDKEKELIYFRGYEFNVVYCDPDRHWAWMAGMEDGDVTQVCEATPENLNRLQEMIGEKRKLPDFITDWVHEKGKTEHMLTTIRNMPDEQIRRHWLNMFPVKLSMYTHQIRGAILASLSLGLYREEFSPLSGYQKSPGFALLMEMGTGKTLCAIAIAGLAYQRKLVKRILIICPSSLIFSWVAEFANAADYPVETAALVGAREKRLKTLKELTRKSGVLQVAIINYESTRREGIYEALLNFKADMVICDESQRIKSNKTDQSRAAHMLGDEASYRLALTGTPIQSEFTDLWSQYRFLDSRIFGTVFWRFRSHYARMGGYQKHQVLGIRKEYEADLIQKEYSIAYRVTKEEALDLPDQVFLDIPVMLSPKERSAYSQMLNESVAELNQESTITATTVLTRLLRLQQITGGFSQEDETGKIISIGTAKLDALRDLMEDSIASGEKLVIFARFRPEIAGILDVTRRVLPKGKKAVAIHGDVDAGERREAVEAFQNDPDTMVFVGQIDTAGAGITLTAAHKCIYYSMNFNYASYEQSTARIHRIGQKEKCTYLRLVAANTIDERIAAALKRKENLADRIVDSWRQVLGVETPGKEKDGRGIKKETADL